MKEIKIFSHTGFVTSFKVKKSPTFNYNEGLCYLYDDEKNLTAIIPAGYVVLVCDRETKNDVSFESNDFGHKKSSAS